MNLAELRWRTRELVGPIADTELETSPDDLDLLLNASERNLLGQRPWRFLESELAVTTVAGQATYTLTPPAGSEVRRVRGVALTVGGTVRLLRPRPAFALDQRADADDRDEPREYVLTPAGALTLVPTPDAAYSLTVRATLTSARMSADADVPALPEDFHELLAYSAAARVLRRRRADGDVGRADDLDAFASAEVDRLIREDLGDHDRTPMQMGGRRAWRGVWPRHGFDQGWR